MQGAQTRAAAGWGSKAAVSGRSIVAAKPGAAGSDGQRPKRGAAAQAAGGNVAGVLDAIERSPLGMKLEANHPGLGMLAQSMVRAGNALRRLGGGIRAAWGGSAAASVAASVTPSGGAAPHGRAQRAHTLLQHSLLPSSAAAVPASTPDPPPALISLNSIHSHANPSHPIPAAGGGRGRRGGRRAGARARPARCQGAHQLRRAGACPALASLSFSFACSPLTPPLPGSLLLCNFVFYTALLPAIASSALPARPQTIKSLRCTTAPRPTTHYKTHQPHEALRPPSQRPPPH